MDEPILAIEEWLAQQGWQNVKKIGSGVSADVFSGSKKGEYRDVEVAIKVFRNNERYKQQAGREADALLAVEEHNGTTSSCCVRLIAEEEKDGRALLVVEKLTCTLDKIMLATNGLLHGRSCR